MKVHLTNNQSSWFGVGRLLLTDCHRIPNQDRQWKPEEFRGRPVRRRHNWEVVKNDLMKLGISVWTRCKTERKPDRKKIYTSHYIETVFRSDVISF